MNRDTYYKALKKVLKKNEETCPILKSQLLLSFKSKT